MLLRRGSAAAMCLLLVTFAATGAPRPLTTATQVKRLSMQEAAARQEAVLRGVVTQVIPEWWSFSLQDSTGGVYVSSGVPLPAELQVGQAVAIDGHTAPGNFAPTVRASAIRILGPARMPPARPVTWQNLATGGCDNDYVEVQGVVRSAGMVGPPAWEWRAAALRLDLGANFVWAYLRDAPAVPSEPLVDSAVRVRGVCLVFSNSQRQFQGVALSVARPADLTVVRPSPRDPFDAPLQKIGRLFGFQLGSGSFHRIRVSGVATLQVPGGIYVQEGSAAVLLRAPAAPPVRPGDRIEAVGFPSTGDFTTVLEDALVRVSGPGSEPAPRDIAADKVLTRIGNAPAVPSAVLLRVPGRVVDRTRSARDEILILADGNSSFTARVPLGPQRLRSAEPGSRVAVTGVCAVQVDDRGLPQSFELLMRSPADVRLLQSPPRISRNDALRAAGALAIFLAAAVFGLALLRKRVEKQTEMIRKQFERERSLEQRYSELVENASDIVYVRALDGRLLQVNRGAEEMTGYTRNELLRMNVLELLAPDERERARQELASQSARGTAAPVSEWHFLTKDGRELVVETKQRLLTEGDGPARVESIGRDVTARDRAQAEAIHERDRLQEQLHHSQKMDSIGRLAGGVAHDFNNLLTVISGYAEMVLDSLPPADPNRDAIREIAHAAERASGLTRQLLLFSRRQKSTPEVISLNALVANLERMLRRLIGEDIELSLSLDAQPGRILADPGHIEQVIMNLAVNARDAMPAGGRLEIRTRDFHAGEDYTRRNPEVSQGDYIALEIADTGTGMTAEVRRRIFEPFFTTKEQGKGTGLGLSMAYGIVKETGGAILVDSEPGRGTSFHVLFPAAEAPDRAGSEREPDAAPVSGSETILVAEDETGVRRYIHDVLSSHGYTVLEAHNGSEALARAREHSGPIHLLLTDTVMPEMGGAALAERFSELRPGVPVVHMSGYTDRPLPDSVRQELLRKPFSPSMLLERVRAALK